jgi:hypothetical protein
VFNNITSDGKYAMVYEKNAVIYDTMGNVHYFTISLVMENEQC